MVQFLKGEYTILVCDTKKMSETTELKKKQDTKLYSHKIGMIHTKILIVVVHMVI